MERRGNQYVIIDFLDFNVGGIWKYLNVCNQNDLGYHKSSIFPGIASSYIGSFSTCWATQDCISITCGDWTNLIICVKMGLERLTTRRNPAFDSVYPYHS